MPLELGMFLAAKKYGAKEQKHKSCLVVDKEEFRYQKFISDIAGQDIQAHNNEPAKVIKKIRNWLSIASKRKSIPGASEIHKRYETFKRSLPTLCKTVRIEVDELTFNDYATIVSEWLKENP
jgi:uncharacterized protein VirK/YbjX